LRRRRIDRASVPPPGRGRDPLLRHGRLRHARRSCGDRPRPRLHDPGADPRGVVGGASPGTSVNGSPRNARLVLYVVGFLLMAALVGLAVGPEAFHPRLPDAPPLHQRWMATPTTVERLRAIDPAIAALYFDRRGSYVLGGGLEAATVAAGWADETRFAEDLAAGAIRSDVRFVMYDPEGWPSTPVKEQRHPVAAMRAFAAAARSAGYGVIITPNPSLVDVPKAECGRSANETMEAAFLRCGI